MTDFAQTPVDSARAELEHELSSYACLHISAMQLATARDATALLQHIAELLDQLVGASRFELRALSPDGEQLKLLVERGQPGLVASRPVAEGAFHDAIEQGRVVFAPVLDGRVQPLAVVPLCCMGEVVAVLSIDALHGHKSAWAAADSQLFDVLSAVGGVALATCAMTEGCESPRAELMRLSERLVGKSEHASTMNGAEET